VRADPNHEEREPARLDNRRYYDEFAAWYEAERGRGYHKLIDDLEVETVARYGRGKDILEAGCGTGLILERVAEFASRAAGVDLSAGMLAQARARGLEVAQGSITSLPYPDDRFDVVYSFKVLAHIPDIEGALAEMARVTRPGGVVLAEFYNPLSLRYLVKALKPPTAISERTADTAVYTRYDSLSRVRELLPADLALESLRGVRVITPVSHIHKIPGVRALARAAEHALADAPLLRRLGGFLIAIARKRGA
jgi:ubiquinone/menaquinone biosynthesis C-methylase UbiE